MTNGIIKADSPAVIKSLEVMAAQPGATAEQIAEQAGISLNYTRKVLCFVMRRGLAGHVHLDGVHESRGRGWYAAKDLQEARDKWTRLARQRATERKKLGLIKLVEMREGKISAMGAVPVHRILKAGSKKPLPFVCRAVPSVFALGEQA